ncbi:DUF3306 domain-containing protein [Faunimonas sp. B44]|uniref:DUF3306 domain-containing protein n=1 Tax=Faunimonas sp. B44 TaxID=3461493 RepID=UPI00404511C8
MSEREQSFLARWSRRKLEAGTDPAEAEIAPAAPEEAVGAEAAQEAAPAEEPIPEADLPRIEEVTAESDLSAFLRKGVPQALRAAALRKAWALDPTIRSYVGPAENAWDFNDPASIPGFGPAAGGAGPNPVRFSLREEGQPGEHPEAAKAPEPRTPAPSDAPDEAAQATENDAIAEDAASAAAPAAQPGGETAPPETLDAGSAMSPEDEAEGAPGRGPERGRSGRHGGALPA